MKKDIGHRHVIEFSKKYFYQTQHNGSQPPIPFSIPILLRHGVKKEIPPLGKGTSKEIIFHNS